MAAQLTDRFFVDSEAEAEAEVRVLDVPDKRCGRLHGHDLLSRHQLLALVKQLLGRLVVDGFWQVVHARVVAHLESVKRKNRCLAH